MTRLGRVIAAVLVATFWAVAVGTPVVGALDSNSVEAYVFERINVERADRGVAPLLWGTQMAVVATNAAGGARLFDATTQGFYFQRVINDYLADLTPFRLVEGSGVGRGVQNFTFVNGAYLTPAESADKIVNEWLASGAATRLLEPGVTDIGIGTVSDTLVVYVAEYDLANYPVSGTVEICGVPTDWPPYYIYIDADGRWGDYATPISLGDDGFGFTQYPGTHELSIRGKGSWPGATAVRGVVTGGDDDTSDTTWVTLGREYPALTGLHAEINLNGGGPCPHYVGGLAGSLTVTGLPDGYVVDQLAINFQSGIYREDHAPGVSASGWTWVPPATGTWDVFVAASIGTSDRFAEQFFLSDTKTVVFDGTEVSGIDFTIDFGYHELPSPELTGAYPSSGSSMGGTSVRLTGSGFTGATGVTFGGVAGTGLSVADDGSLTVSTPAHAAGAVNVIVSTPSGSSPPAVFTFVAPASRFTDVPVSHPFYAHVEWLATQGITNGYADGRFGVVDRVTRGQMAVFLYKMAGSPAYTAPAESRFPDVPVTHPFYKYVSWLVDQGISNGYGNGNFGVADAVTRGQMSVFLYKFAGSPAYTPPVTAQFPDVPVTHPFYKYVSWLVSKHISNGYGNGNFGGADPVTRGQMAVFLYNYAHLP